MDTEKFIYLLIKHIKEFGYWSDCEIYFGNKCWSDFDLGFFDTNASLIERKEDIYVHEVNSYHNDLVITLLDRQGGLLYRDMNNPWLHDLSYSAEQYMLNHESMYYIQHHGFADGDVALFALEEFLFDNEKIIVDWIIDEYKSNIIIADITLDAIKRRDNGYVSFKKRIGHDY